MRAVMLEVPWSLLEERRRQGLDRRDEIWNGELHMVPPPHGEHGRLNAKLELFFGPHWEDQGLGRSYPETGVKRPGAGSVQLPGGEYSSDYRTPDRSFLVAGHQARFVGGWIVGGPDAVLEIVSPGGESREKLPFYFSVGVREVLLIDRDTRAVELLRAGPSGFASVGAVGGWFRSEVLSVELRQEVDPTTGSGALRLRRLDDPSREVAIRP